MVRCQAGHMLNRTLVLGAGRGGGGGAGKEEGENRALLNHTVGGVHLKSLTLM